MQTNLLSRSKQLLLTIFFASISFLAVSKSNQSVFLINPTDSIHLNFNEKINLNQIGLHANDQISWKITDTLDNEIANSKSGSLTEFVFAIPGKYKLTVVALPSQTHAECNHGDFSGSWDIYVAQNKVVFNVDQIIFSSNLNSDNLIQGIDLSIPVQIINFNNIPTPTNTSSFRIMVQGVDCNVQATILNPEIIEFSGNYLLKVNLKGKAPDHSYIMIDFVDQNGQITTYYHASEL